MMRIPQRSSWRAPLGRQWGLPSSSSVRSCQPQDRSQQSRTHHTASSSLRHSAPTGKAQQSGAPESPRARTRTRVHAKYRQGYYSNIKFPGFNKCTVVIQKSVLVLRKYTLEDWRIKRDVCDLLPNGWGDAYTQRADMQYSTYPEPLRHSKSGEVTMEWLSSRLQVRALFLWLYFKFLKAAFYFYNPHQPHETVMP